MVRELQTSAIVSATFAANLPANNKVYGTITLDPAIAAVAQLQVPVTESWVVEDLFVAAAQTPDAILELKRNLVASLLKSAPINGCLVTNVARPVPTPVQLKGADILTIEAQNLAAIGASAQTVTVYLMLRRFVQGGAS